MQYCIRLFCFFMGYREHNQLSISKLAEEDRPREKLLLKGRRSLSDAELIGILLGSGNTTMNAVELARMVLSQTGNNLHNLAKYSVEDLQQFKGIGEAKAIAVISALELGRRRKDAEAPEFSKIMSSRDVYELLKPHLLDLDHEQFWLICLNKANKVLSSDMISSGGQSATYVDPKLVFKKAIDRRAAQIILAHNHPSGNIRPSQSDIDLTKKLMKAGYSLDLPVLDHIIFGEHTYFSFIDESII